MILVIRICVVDPSESLQFLETRLVHDLVVPDDLDGHLLVAPEAVPGPDHVGEDPLTRVSINRVPYFIIILLVGSNFTVKGNIQDVTKVTGTITKQKHNNK